jgi:hypothetical protein
MIDATKAKTPEEFRAIGRAILAEIIGAPPTWANAMLWVARERQKNQRPKLRVVNNDTE